MTLSLPLTTSGVQAISIQKSREGLFRALLLQILNQRPELTPTLCAERWNAPYGDVFNPWSQTQLINALGELGKMDGTRWTICLFIDGLDEYAGDHAELVKIIRRMAASDNIKVCASSRPWLDFYDAFGGSQWKLYLQDFTQQDIRQFVQDNLLDDLRFNKLQQRNKVAADKLASEITKRASGVFLWVFLVVRSLLRGLRNEDDISDLQRRLRELPSDLQEYFDRMLVTIEDVYKERAARLFLTIVRAYTAFPVITFYFMDLGDEPLPIEPLPFLREWPLVDPIEAEALSMKKRQLIAQCKDLISITPEPGAPILFSERVGFLHRTVVDFLDTPDAKESLLGLAGADFKPTKILFKANLGQARSLMHLYRRTYIMPYLRQWILGSLYYAHEVEVSSGSAEVEGLDELEVVIMREFGRWSFSHAMQCIFDRPEITSLLELACKCDLALYVLQKHPNCNPSKLDILASGWRNPLEVHQDSGFEIRQREITYGPDSDWRLGRELGVLSLPKDSHALKEEQEIEQLVANYNSSSSTRKRFSFKLTRAFSRWSISNNY